MFVTKFDGNRSKHDGVRVKKHRLPEEERKERNGIETEPDRRSPIAVW